MSLKDSLDKEVIPPNFGCSIRHLRKKMSKEDLEVLDKALEDRDITSASLNRALKSEGFFISVHSIGRHRRGDCNCRSKKV